MLGKGKVTLLLGGYAMCVTGQVGWLACMSPRRFGWDRDDVT